MPRGPLIVFVTTLVALVATDTVSADPCVIHSKAATVEGVKIRPTGEDAFQIKLSKLPIEVTPRTTGEAELLVKSPIRFTTTHSINRVGIRLAKKTSLYGGRLVVAKGISTYFHDNKSKAQAAKILAEGRAAVRFPLREFLPSQSPVIPCDALTSVSEIEHYEAPELILPSHAAAHVVSRGDTISLYRERVENDPLQLKFDGPLIVLRRKNGWVHVRAKWSDGSRLQGWVRKSQVAIQHEMPRHTLHGIGGTIGLGLCGSSHRPRLVTFKIHGHAPIHSKAGGAIWAHTAGTITVKAFALARSDGWIQVASLNGFPTGACTEHSRFWVHAKHVLWTSKPI